MTSVSIAEPTPFSGNPIDLVEEIVIANDWAHGPGQRESWCRDFRRWCDYRLYFVWQEEICAMALLLWVDMKIPKGPGVLSTSFGAGQRETLLGHF